MAAVNTSPASTPVSQKQNTKPTYEELEKRNQSLEARLKIAEAANAEIQNVNDTLAKRMDAMELEKRTEKIASIVQGAYDENVEEKISDLVRSAMSIEQIDKFVEPLRRSKTKTKQASASSPNYSSTVAIQNESLPAENGKKEIPAWASNYLHVTNGGSA